MVRVHVEGASGGSTRPPERAAALAHKSAYDSDDTDDTFNFSVTDDSANITITDDTDLTASSTPPAKPTKDSDAGVCVCVVYVHTVEDAYNTHAHNTPTAKSTKDGGDAKPQAAKRLKGRQASKEGRPRAKENRKSKERVGRTDDRRSYSGQSGDWDSEEGRDRVRAPPRRRPEHINPDYSTLEYSEYSDRRRQP
jgi:hypothetical protein